MGFKNEDVSGSSLMRELLPIDFYRFLNDVDATCVNLASENVKFKVVGNIASNIRNLKYRGSRKEENLVKNPYYGKTSRECFQMFYEHIQQPYELIDGEISLGLSVTELKQLDDARLNADSHTKFTTGKFDIKEWRVL